MHKMKEFVDPKFLEKKYSGEFENLEEFWPPRCFGDATKTFDENSLLKNNIVPFTYSRSELELYTYKNRKNQKLAKGSSSFRNIDSISPKGDNNFNLISTCATSKKKAPGSLRRLQTF